MVNRIKQSKMPRIHGWHVLWSEYLCFLPDAYVEILTPNVMVLEDGVFGRRWSESGGLMNGINAHKRDLRELSGSFYDVRT